MDLVYSLPGKAYPALLERERRVAAAGSGTSQPIGSAGALIEEVRYG